MSSLGLVEGGSRAGQGGQSKQVTMQDQATSPIVIEDDASENNDDERIPDASNRSANVQDNLENTHNENSGNDSQDSATNDGNDNTAQNRPLRRSPRNSSRQSATSGNNTVSTISCRAYCKNYLRPLGEKLLRIMKWLRSFNAKDFSPPISESL